MSATTDPSTLARVAMVAGRRYGKTAHLELVRRRHTLLLAAVDDSRWRPWRRHRRLRELATVEAALDLTGFPW